MQCIKCHTEFSAGANADIALGQQDRDAIMIITKCKCGESYFAFTAPEWLSETEYQKGLAARPSRPSVKRL
jgi:RNase P subunit RPR2